MKKTNIYIVLSSMFILSSCSKDNGNYNYSETERIEIEGIEANYAVISLQDSLKISPTAKSNKEGELAYYWALEEKDVAGRIVPLDTIAQTQNLSYFVTEDAKNWNLICIVKNKATGYSEYKTTEITVSTPFSRGWYILKDDGAQTDLDLFLTPEDHVVDGKLENVYSAVNGAQIEGKASFMSFSTQYQSNIVDPSIYANVRSLFLTTDKDIQTVSVNNLKKIRDRQDIFFGGVQKISGTTGAFIGKDANYAINNGKLHQIYARNDNTGQFGNETMLDRDNTPYELSKFMISSEFNNPLLFDNLGGNFTTSAGFGSTMTIFTNDPNNEMSTTKNNQRALFMGLKSNVSWESRFKTIGYAILQDKTHPNIKSLCSLEQAGTILSVKKESIDPTSKLFDATFHTLLFEDENLLYFVHNNQVYSQNLSNGFERLQFSTPAGEQVCFIKHLKYSESKYSFNYVIIGTKVGAKYKIRMFTKNSGNLNINPEQTLEGNGTAAALLYIAPSVSDFTYPWSY